MYGACLVRVDALSVDRCNEKTNPTVIYLNQPYITVGSGQVVNYRIQSRCLADLHAVITPGANSNEWFCTSSSYGKGTFVNGRRMRDGCKFLLEDGNLIRFGLDHNRIGLHQYGPTNCFVCRIPTVMVHNCEGGSRRNHHENHCNGHLIAENRFLEEFERMKADISAKEIELAKRDEEMNKLKEEMVDLKERVHRKDRDRTAVLEKLDSALHHSAVTTKTLQELVNTVKGPVSSGSDSLTTPADGLPSSVMNILETEFQCGICMDVVIDPETLQCSHMFCSYCIMEWLKRKDDCPICRKTTLRFTKSVAVDGFIDKILNLLSPEMKARRLETIAERRTAQETIQRRGIAAVGSYLGVDSEDIDSEADYEEITFYHGGVFGHFASGGSRGYYGGYGNCFICHQRGHWANGCPFQ